MEESKHVCKFCRKIFPCGRSLGGHMRSHVSGNHSAETEDSLAATKLSRVEKENGEAAASATGYDLREQRKKTWRVADSSDGTKASEKLCKQCGKGFRSWKALFGHMKCHSQKERASVTDDDHNHNSLEDQDSWTVMDSQSDNEPPRPRTRIRSKRTRTTTTSSLSFSNLSSSVSEIEQEQEEVALSLMMLSRGVASRGSREMGSEKKPKRSELLTPDHFPRSGSSKSKTRMIDFQSAMEDSEEDDKEQGKRNFKFLGSELNSNPSRSSDRRSKFECATCNKVFRSYQALGGHRASHKKIARDCFVPIDETSDNSIKPDLSHHEAISGSDLHEDAELDKSKDHERSISLKSFPSGQAMDGHKRSHSTEAPESRKAESTDLIEEPVEKIRDLIDLNLPADADAAEEEDSNNNSNSECYRSSPWWVRSIHNKQEALVGLLSN
ncbi:zinc finger protein ZAT1-like [Neltuma alba]|uniref:zinc finger protein ZAT1-like n=1 Tax=Neltuma alba TaxID=207710 RepID=UPI0010A38010|nr:zinc finger protein ZAT1-like [Prosopis alba]